MSFHFSSLLVGENGNASQVLFNSNTGGAISVFVVVATSDDETKGQINAKVKQAAKAALLEAASSL